MPTILVKAGRGYYKARVNPKPRMPFPDDLDRYATLMRLYVKASREGKLRLMMTMDRKIQQFERRMKLDPV